MDHLYHRSGEGGRICRYACNVARRELWPDIGDPFPLESPERDKRQGNRSNYELEQHCVRKQYINPAAPERFQEALMTESQMPFQTWYMQIKRFFERPAMQQDRLACQLHELRCLAENTSKTVAQNHSILKR